MTIPNPDPKPYTLRVLAQSQEKFESKIDRLPAHLAAFYKSRNTRDKVAICAYHKVIMAKIKIGDLSAMELAIRLAQYVYEQKKLQIIREVRYEKGRLQNE